VERTSGTKKTGRRRGKSGLFVSTEVRSRGKDRRTSQDSTDGVPCGVPAESTGRSEGGQETREGQGNDEAVVGGGSVAKPAREEAVRSVLEPPKQRGRIAHTDISNVEGERLSRVCEYS
jgi:hypothetical protein